MPPSTGLAGIVTDVVFSNGALYQYDYAGAHFLSNNVHGVGVAFDLVGREVTNVFAFSNGALYQYDYAAHTSCPTTCRALAWPSTWLAAR